MRLKVNKYLWMTSLNPKVQLKYEYGAASEYDFKLINPVLGAGGLNPPFQFFLPNPVSIYLSGLDTPC